MSKIIREYLSLARIATLARTCGVPRTTIIHAIGRGEIPVTATADGLDLVRPSDLEHWLANRPQVGRPANATTVESTRAD